MLLVSSPILLPQCEIFVRGHDVPWSFELMAWSEPWAAFYGMSEKDTFREGLRFLDLCQQKNLSPAIQDIGRMLIYNRLPNLCFTRDRLLFYGMQQAAAKRAKWERQTFAFEASYYLNFYYLLIYGGFDHLALVVNGVLGLGMPEKQVGATYEGFLKSLLARAPEIHAIFTDQELVEFIQRVGALRHFAAHRGSIRPGELYEKPDVEPTDEELDEEISRLGLDRQLGWAPEGPIRDWAWNLLRYKVRLQKAKKIAEGVVFIEIKGKWYFMHPLADTEWNFRKFHNFMVKVLNACGSSM